MKTGERYLDPEDYTSLPYYYRLLFFVKRYSNEAGILLVSGVVFIFDIVTGVSASVSGLYLIQGGIIWDGFNLPPPPGTNSKGFALVMAYNLPNNVRNFTCPPPTSMKGVGGQEIIADTVAVGSCWYRNGINGSVWAEHWYVRKLSKVIAASQIMACDMEGAPQVAWSIFESTADLS